MAIIQRLSQPKVAPSIVGLPLANRRRLQKRGRKQGRGNSPPLPSLDSCHYSLSTCAAEFWRTATADAQLPRLSSTGGPLWGKSGHDALTILLSVFLFLAAPLQANGVLPAPWFGLLFGLLLILAALLVSGNWLALVLILVAMGINAVAVVIGWRQPSTHYKLPRTYPAPIET
jgi:hypothetical protein